MGTNQTLHPPQNPLLKSETMRIYSFCICFFYVCFVSAVFIVVCKAQSGEGKLSEGYAAGGIS